MLLDYWAASPWQNALKIDIDKQEVEINIQYCLNQSVESSDINVYLAERQSMAKGNKLCSLLGGLNSSDTRGRKHVAFSDLIFCN